MKKIIIQKERIHSTDPRLKRHINHDSRSRDFEFDTRKLSIVSVEHKRYIPILDQGQVGSCTGNAGIGDIGCDPLYSVLPKTLKYTLNETGALKLYSDAEMIDGDGPYPPNDNGSNGLSIAQALKTAGIIAAYQHTFSLDAALKAASVTPFITGINWYENMFNPDKDGRVHITGKLKGGHEIVCRKIDAKKKQVWFDNSWGTSWGVKGSFYLSFEDFGTLLSRRGDVTILLPISKPIPAPVPVANADDETLAAAMKNWLAAKEL